MPRPLQFQIHAIATLAAVLAAGACEDPATPTVPTEDAAPLRGVIACRADVPAGTISCQRSTPDPAPGLALSSIVGGQGTYVQLTSGNVSYTSGIFEADVTVQNLIAQPMGTPDGTTVTGIRVFFHSGPTVTSGTGTVSVANEDGTGAFTSSGQPYFEYGEILPSGSISSPKTWQWSVPPTVGTFEFSVYIDTDIQLLDVWRFRYALYTGSPNPTLPHEETAVTAVLLQERDGEMLGGEARRVERWYTRCDISGCLYSLYDSIAQAPLTGSIRGSDVELQFDVPGEGSATFTGTYYPVRDSMGGENWYAIRSSDPAPPTVAAPTGLTASIDPGPRVRLEWTDNSSNELGFNIYEGCSGAPPANFGSLPADRDAGIVWGLTDRYGQSCSYEVRAFVQDGAWGIVESQASNVASVQIPVGPISGIQPAAGDVGTRVAIMGSGFAPLLDSLTIDGRLANLFFVSGNDGEIQMLMPNASHSGRVRVTVWKDNSLYGEAAWVQQDAQDTYCEGESGNNYWPSSCNDPLPIDVVGSFAFGDMVDYWGVRLASPNVVDTLVFYLDWDDPFVDLDLYVGRQTLNNFGEYYLYYFCESSGQGTSKPVTFACIVQGEAIYGDIDLRVRNRTAEAGDLRLVSYRLQVNQYP
jgi:hypothetical protein